MKTQTCDTCGRERKDIKSMGRDDNGDPDAPDMCFFCRKEDERRIGIGRAKQRKVRSVKD